MGLFTFHRKKEASSLGATPGKAMPDKLQDPFESPPAPAKPLPPSRWSTAWPHQPLPTPLKLFLPSSRVSFPNIVRDFLRPSFRTIRWSEHYQNENYIWALPAFRYLTNYGESLPNFLLKWALTTSLHHPLSCSIHPKKFASTISYMNRIHEPG